MYRSHFAPLQFLAILLIGANNARILDLSACSSFAAPTPHIILTSLYLVPRRINSLSPAFVRPALKLFGAVVYLTRSYFVPVITSLVLCHAVPFMSGLMARSTAALSFFVPRSRLQAAGSTGPRACRLETAVDCQVSCLARRDLAGQTMSPGDPYLGCDRVMRPTPTMMASSRAEEAANKEA